MNNLIDMVSGPLSGWMFQTGIAVSILTLFVLAIRRPFANYFGARAAYALWSLPLIRLVWPSFTIPDYFGLTQAMPPVESGASIAEVMTVTPMQVVEPGLVMNWGLVLISIWAFGSVTYLAFQARQHACYVKNLRKASQPAPTHLSLLLYKVQKKLALRKCPEIRLSMNEDGPLVTGILRPVIILPQDFFTRFTADQQFYVLMHECAHIRRRDIWASVLCLLFRAVNWPNPIIHFAATKFRADQEAACDATVLRILNQSVPTDRDNTHGYAETLLTAIRTRHGQPTLVPLGLTMTHPLKERLMTIKQSHKKSGWIMRTSAMAMILGIAAVTAPVSFSHPPESLDRLAGEHKTDRMKSVIKVEKDDDGKTVKKHYEITKEDGKVTAFEIDKDGNKTTIDPNDIEGFDPDMMDGHAFSFALNKDHKLKFLKKGEHLPEGMHFKDMENAFVFSMPEPPEAPFPPGFEFEWFGDEDVEVHMDGKRANIQGLILKNRLQGVESQLKAAERLIEQVKKNTQSGKNQQKAQRELEKARKALQAAQRALSEDE